MTISLALSQYLNHNFSKNCIKCLEQLSKNTVQNPYVNFIISFISVNNDVDFVDILVSFEFFYLNIRLNQILAFLTKLQLLFFI